MIRQIRIDDREWQIESDAQDTYLEKIQEYGHGLAGLIAAARRRVRSDSTILDVGANLGLATLALSELVPEGRVIAFEPGPATARHLASTLALNGVRNCTVAPVAVGSKAGTVRFADVPGFTAGAHVVQGDPAAQPHATIVVDVVRLDDWLAEAGVARVDFVKIDVEGHEPWALDGAREMLARDRPAVFMEFNSWCLLAFANVNPVTFARGLWEGFRVSSADGHERELPDAYRFAHDNLVRHGGLNDVLLEPREHQNLPPLARLTGANA